MDAGLDGGCPNKVNITHITGMALGSLHVHFSAQACEEVRGVNATHSMLRLVVCSCIGFLKHQLSHN